MDNCALVGCWRPSAAKAAVAGVTLAGLVAGCASQPAVPRASVTSCAQFGIGAIRRHVTVTAMPAACRGLSQIEVNVAVGQALRAAAAGVRGKARQRQVIARDSPYLAGLIHVAPSQPAAIAPATVPVPGPPSRAALGLAALAAWLVTIGLGASMMARWLARARRRGGPPRHGHGPMLNFTHLGLALAGLLTWIGYLITGVTGLAWTACGLLLPVAGLGMALVFLAPARSGDDPPPVRHRPAFTVAAHITTASVTILLAVLAAVGSG